MSIMKCVFCVFEAQRDNLLYLTRCSPCLNRNLPRIQFPRQYVRHTNPFYERLIMRTENGKWNKNSCKRTMGIWLRLIREMEKKKKHFSRLFSLSFDARGLSCSARFLRSLSIQSIFVSNFAFFYSTKSRKNLYTRRSVSALDYWMYWTYVVVLAR